MRLAPCTGFCRQQQALNRHISCMDGCAEAAAAASAQMVGTFGPGTVLKDSKRTNAGLRGGMLEAQESLRGYYDAVVDAMSVGCAVQV